MLPRRSRRGAAPFRWGSEMLFHTTLARGLSSCLTVFLCFAQIPIDRPLTTHPVLPSTVVLEQNIAYDRYPATVLDILRPRAASSRPKPGVVIIHGGGWMGGTKEERLEYAGMQWAGRGFVAASINYRLGHEAPAPAAVHDVLTATRWFHAHAAKYGVDPKRIVVTGESAGGHLALMVGMTPSSAGLGPTTPIAAVINFCGIADVADQLAGPHAQEYAQRWVPEQDGRLDLARRVSPLIYVRKGLPPILTIHGDADPVVPYEQSVRLTKALREAADDVELITVKQNTHGFTGPVLDRVFVQIFAFLGRRGIMP